MDQALDAYVPGVRVGMPVEEAGKAYDLQAAPQVAPLVGYADSTYRHASGMTDLLIVVDEDFMRTPPERSPKSAVRSVSLSTDQPAAATAVEADLRKRLGEPRAFCVQNAPGDQTRLLHWGQEPDPLASLSIPSGLGTPSSASPGSLDVRGRAWLTFGGEAPDTVALKERPCPPTAP